MGVRDKKKGGGDGEAKAPLWMCTFSDMMSLLLCFFVLLFAMSTVEKKKFVQAIGSIQGALGKIPDSFDMSIIEPTNMDPQPMVKPMSVRVLERAKDAIAHKEREVLIADKMSNKIRIVGVKEGIRFSLEGSLLFEEGSAELTADGEINLASVATRLQAYPSNRIRVEGHTDNVNITGGKFKDNWHLSEQRALTVLHYLEEFFTDHLIKSGLFSEANARKNSHNRLSMEAYGPYAPVASNDTEEGRAQNRRVDIILLNSERSEFIEGDVPDLPETPQRDAPLPVVDPEFRG